MNRIRMKVLMVVLCMAGALAIGSPRHLSAQEPNEDPGVERKLPGALVWSDLTAPGFAPGVKMAVVHGDPASQRDFIVRIRFPAGYYFPVHWHPNSEHVTVISGTLLFATGGSGDRARLRAFPAGSFLYAPGRTSHYGGARGVTEIQVHGQGPFDLNAGIPPAP